MDLNDTITLMQSDDYTERLRAEYWQLKIRLDKLNVANNRDEIACRTGANSMDTPKDCVRRDIMRSQQYAMEKYLHNLELRAELDGIEL